MTPDEQQAINTNIFERLGTLEQGQARMEAQHEHLDKCIDGLKDEVHGLRDDIAALGTDMTKLTVKMYALAGTAATVGTLVGQLLPIGVGP